MRVRKVLCLPTEEMLLSILKVKVQFRALVHYTLVKMLDVLSWCVVSELSVTYSSSSPSVPPRIDTPRTAPDMPTRPRVSRL